MEEYKSLTIDKEKKERNLEEIRRAAAAKKVRNYPNFIQSMLIQLKYRPVFMWMLEGVCLGAAFAVCRYFKSWPGPELFTVCAIFLVLSGNIGFAGLGRLFSRNMAELEQALYLNLKQMAAIQLLFGGILDLLVFGIFVLLLGPARAGETAVFALYLLVPFVWADVWILWAFTLLRGITSGLRQAGTALLSAAVAAAPYFIPHIYDRSCLPLWGLALLAGGGALVLAVKRIFCVIEGGEELCLS